MKNWYHELEEFQAKILRRGCPVSGAVRSWGEGDGFTTRVEYASRNFFNCVGAAGIGKYSLDHPGRIHVVALAGLFRHEVNSTNDALVEHSPGVGLDYMAHVAAGDFPSDIAGFAKGIVARSSTFKSKTFMGFAFIVAEDGKVGSQVRMGVPESLDIDLVDSVRMEGGKLIYAISGEERDCSAYVAD